MRTKNIMTGWWYCAAACALFALVLGYSCYKLSESPPTWYDEGLYIQVAQSLATSGTQSLQIAPGEGVSTGFVSGGYPFLAPVALSLRLFGDSLLAARLPMVLFILLCAGAAFVLIYKISGRYDALLALALLATLPLLYGNGKNVIGEVPGLVYVFLALFSLWKLERYGYASARWYLLTGLFVGLAAATKPIFLLLPLAFGIVFLLRIRRIPWHWRTIALAALACLAPLLLWAYLQFGTTDALSLTLFHYSNPYAEQSLVSTVLHNALRFFRESTPLYCAVLMLLWLLSVGIRTVRKTAVSSAEMTGFVFSLLILAAYLRTEGWYRYFFEAMVLALVFAPLSVRTIAEAVAGRWGALRPYLAYAPAVLVLLALAQFYQLNTTSWVAEHYGSTETAALQQYFSAVPPDTSIFVYDSPDAVPFIRSSDYYQYIQATPALGLGQENFPLLQKGTFNEVIVTPDNYRQEAALFARYRQSGTVGGFLILTPLYTK